ncbi:MAG: hypothetical protein CMJ76_12840 [Planctomycetaceae bacterium]|nr:hypothetical protein [Planctomycetaceae bacterium]
MSILKIRCPRCDSLIKIQRVDLRASLCCLTCNAVFELKPQLDRKSFQWLTRLTVMDYLTLGDGLNKVEGAQVLMPKSKNITC